MKTVITGGTGLVGKSLLAELRGETVVLSRRTAASDPGLGNVNLLQWDPARGPPPKEALEGSNVVFNLAGEPVAEGRWTSQKKRRILDSRVEGTRNLVAGLASLDRRPDVLVSASAVGFYGSRGDEELDETSTAGRGFLADVCAQWEREAMKAEALGIRVVCVRIGIVLAREGGALTRMLTPFRLGAGGKLGNGKQWMPWVHIDDLVGILLHSSETEVRGPINAASPNPVTNVDFTRTLGRVLRRPTFLPVPRLALKVAFGEMSDILLASQRALPKVAQSSGYSFGHPTLEEAVESIITSDKPRDVERVTHGTGSPVAAEEESDAIDLQLKTATASLHQER